MRGVGKSRCAASAAEAALASARQKLLHARAKREPPARDDKILTAWNGLAVKGLVKVSLQLDEPRWLDAAMSCVDFIRRELWDGNRLYATWRGSAKTPGFLDDYANLLDALLTLMAAHWRESDAAFALTLADQTLELFEDKAHGGFYFTAETKNLIHRPKPTTDDALPPGNAVEHQFPQLIRDNARRSMGGDVDIADEALIDFEFANRKLF